MSKDIAKNRQGNVSEHVVQKFLENQSKELEIREKEIAERQSGHAKQLDYAREVLSANKEVELKKIQEGSKNRYATYIFASVIVLILVVFAVIALYLDKDSIVKDLIHNAMYFFAGSIGGYGYASIKGKSRSSKDQLQD